VYPVPVPRIATVYVRLPIIDAERIIVIMINPSRGDEQREMDLTSTGQLERIIEGAVVPPSEGESSFLAKLEMDAHNQGILRAIEDIRKFGIDAPEEYFPDEETFYDEANALGTRYILEQNPSSGKNIEQLEAWSKRFAQAFVNAYRQWLRQRGRTQDLLTKEQYRIRHTALEDRRHFQESLFPHYVIYLAVIRAQEHLSSTLGPEITLEGLRRIGEYVDVYRQAFDSEGATLTRTLSTW